MSRRKLGIALMQGLGDTIYSRPVLRALAAAHDLYVTTRWPQVVADLPVKLVKALKPSTLRTQRRNMERSAHRYDWHPRPKCWWQRLNYGGEDFRLQRTIAQALESRAQCGELETLDYTLPVPDDWRHKAAWQDHRLGAWPLGIVHQPTVRAEWPAAGRNPPPGVLRACVEAAPHVRWVSIQDLADGQEWLAEDPIPGVHVVTGLSTEEMIGAYSMATVILAGNSYAVPLALALGIPLFFVAGGAYRPELVIDPRTETSGGYEIIRPEPFCACRAANHDCDKPMDPAVAAARFARFYEERRAQWA